MRKLVSVLLVLALLLTTIGASASGSLLDLLSQGAEEVPENLEEVVEEAQETVESVTEEVTEAVETLTEEAQEAAETLTEEVQEAAETLTEEAQEAVETLAEEVAEEVQEAVGAEEGKRGYLMFANSDWSAQYWGEDDSTIAKNTSVTGAGEYTVGLDFTGTEAGASAGLAFMAVGITDGETAFPNYTIEVKAIRVNGEEIEFAKGYTSSDDGITTRMNLYNEWVAELPADARSFDGSIEGAAPIVVSADAFADVKTVEVDFVYHQFMQDTAYVMFADSGWTYQYWGGDAENGVVANNAVIDGFGDYTVGLDFTGTEAGAASGVAFAAVGIVNGEKTYPGAFIKINAIRVNGEAIEFGKGYTSSDDGVTTRMNVYNEWVSELPVDAHSFDGDITDAAAIIVDPAAFAETKTVEIDFSLVPVTDTAYVMFADAGWTYQYWGGDAENGVVANNVTVDGPGAYTVSLDFTGTEAGAASGTAFAALGIVTGEKTFPGYFIQITDIKVNGESIAFEKGYTSSDDGVTTRMNIYNEWVSEVPADARSFDGETADADAIIVDKAAFENVKTIEVSFNYIYGKAPEAAEEGLSEDEAKELLAGEYNAYIGVQSSSYIFRNAWDEANYGRDSETNPGFFDRLTGWDADGNAVDYGGVFEDAVIGSDGEYSVSLTTGEMGFGSDETFNLLFVSTTIPSSLVKSGYLEISDVKIKIGSASTKEFTEVDTSGTYVQLKVLDSYNHSEEAFGYKVPGANETITITFTVKGLTD